MPLMSKILFRLKLYLKGTKLSGMVKISVEVYTAELNLFQTVASFKIAALFIHAKYNVGM